MGFRRPPEAGYELVLNAHTRTNLRTNNVLRTTRSLATALGKWITAHVMYLYMNVESGIFSIACSLWMHCHLPTTWVGSRSRTNFSISFLFVRGCVVTAVPPPLAMVLQKVTCRCDMRHSSYRVVRACFETARTVCMREIHVSTFGPTLSRQDYMYARAREWNYSALWNRLRSCRVGQRRVSTTLQGFPTAEKRGLQVEIIWPVVINS